MINALTTEINPDVETLREEILEMYRNLSNRSGFDAHLDPALTVWESADPRLMRGIGELNELRGPERTGEQLSQLPLVVPTDLVIDAWENTGIVRYLLDVRATPGGPLIELVRVTDVLRRRNDEWLIVHHHAQDLDLSVPVA